MVASFFRNFFTLLGVFLFGVIVGSLVISFPPPSGIDFSPLYEAISIIKERYYFDNNQIPKSFEKELIYGAISGVVEKLNDPYSVFFTPEEVKEFKEAVRGSYEGIGAEIGIKDGALTIISPLKNSPAERTGLMPGDKVIKIDGQTTEGMKIEEAVKKIKGRAETVVKLTIQRNDEIFEESIKRERIIVPSLDFEVINNQIALFRLYHFYENIYSEFERQAREVLKSDLKKIIVDLRNNSGGTLISAIDIASFFIQKEEPILKEKEKDGKIEEIKSKGPSAFSDFRIVVLINQGTASAAEILAGALKEKLGATLVGEKTFGKGTVQELIDLSDGSSLKLTISHWLLPSGRSIEGNGIEPDIEVKMSEEDIKQKKDPQLEKAIEILNK